MSDSEAKTDPNEIEHTISKTQAEQPSIDPIRMAQFRKALSKARNVTVLTGAGVSAGSGIPTFRGKGGLWRKWDVTELATPQAFSKNQSLVWEFYSYRRGLVQTCEPNEGHYQLAKLEKALKNQNKDFTLLTQNVDGFHKKAGSENICEVHGSLWTVKCAGAGCDHKETNWDHPIVPALEGTGSPDPEAQSEKIPLDELPRCTKCGSLARPGVVWFNENLDEDDITTAMKAIKECDLFLVVGTSGIVYPAAGWIMQAKLLGAQVAEFNMERTVQSDVCDFVFLGPSEETLKTAFQDEIQEDI